MSKLVELNLNPDKRTLRNFGFIALFGFGALALMAYTETFMFAFGLGDSRLSVAGVLGGIGVVAALLGLVFPSANRLLFVGMSVVAFPIGFVLSYLIMFTLFYLIIAPIGLVLRVLGNDPLGRSFDRDRGSYWVDARPARPAESYFRQF